MTRLGVLVCGRPPEAVIAAHGDYLDWFGALFAPHGLTLQVWDAVGGTLPAHPDDADAWLLTGSPHGVYEPHDFLPPLEDFTRRIIAAHKPTVGICFGHQLVAQAMGGTVRKFDGGWAFGRRPYEVTGLGRVHLNACHQDQVIVAPPGATVIASNAFTTIAGMRLGSCITLQPHPEISAQTLAGYIAHFKASQSGPHHLIEQAKVGLDQPTDEGQIGAWLARHLMGARELA